jgi:hypothetical protein
MKQSQEIFQIYITGQLCAPVLLGQQLPED